MVIWSTLKLFYVAPGVSYGNTLQSFFSTGGQRRLTIFKTFFYILHVITVLYWKFYAPVNAIPARKKNQFCFIHHDIIILLIGLLAA